MCNRPVCWLVLAWLVGWALAVPAEEKPLTRDLSVGEYDAMFYGLEKNSAAGFSVAVGDVNGDGKGDLIIGALYSDAYFAKKIRNAGVTYVYFGRSELEKTVDLSASADLIIYGASKLEHSGFAVAAGDLNDDGIQDIVIGAPEADSKLVGKRNDSGVTYVVFGRKQFAEKKIGLEAGEADVELHSPKNGEYSGSSLAVGDFNGDEVDDLLIGSPFTDVPFNDAGVVYVVCGHRSLTGRKNLHTDSCSSVRGVKAGDRLGMAVAAADLNGDRIDDLILGALETDGPTGASNVGEVTVIAGRPDLPKELRLADGLFRFRGSNSGDYVGSALATGDVNGDGVSDLIIGVPYADLRPSDEAAEGTEGASSKEADAGKVFVFYGGTGFGGDKSIREGADVALLGGQGGTNYGDHAGGSVGSGDLNGDGRAELVVGAPLADVHGRTRPNPDQMKDVGAVFVVVGRPDLPGVMDLESHSQEIIFGARKNDFFAGVALTKPRRGFGGLLNPDSYRKAWVTRRYDRFFSRAITSGDINGDGLADLVIGAPAADGPITIARKIDDAGVVYVILGKRD